jgi:hypothetical protein
MGRLMQIQQILKSCLLRAVNEIDLLIGYFFLLAANTSIV